MSGGVSTLYAHVDKQLRDLCAVLGLDPSAPASGLRALLEPIADRPLSEPPLWRTDISDDHSPVEFSIACAAGKPPVLRMLGETVAARPSRLANLRSALALADRLAGPLGLALDRFHQVRELFLDAEPQTDFGMWFSLVYPPDAAPEVKIYVNPDSQGADRNPELVAEALRRLHLADAYPTIMTHGTRPEEHNQRDRFSFFAVDLHDQAHSRVKVYLAHRDATPDDLVRAAGAVEGIDPGLVREFLELAGCARLLTHRPPMSGYTFLATDTNRPSIYNLYLPIRDYVADDEQAHDRAVAIMSRFGVDPAVLDKAIAAITNRRLRDGVGLIAHVALRLAADTVPGVTIYLSSESYQVLPPRPRAATDSDTEHRSRHEAAQSRVLSQSGSTSCR